MKGKLKILIYVCIVLLLVSASAFAGQGKEISLRVSYYEPEDADTGFAIGGSFGTAFNENVAISIGTDVYFKNYEQRTAVASETGPNWESTLYTTDISYRSLAIPLLLEVKANINIIGPLSIFGHAGGGYEVFWVREQNSSSGESNSKFFGGWVWVAGVGPSFKLGHDSWIFVEGYYTGAKVKRNRRDLTVGLPVFQEVDLSGFGIRAGITTMSF